MTTDEGGSALAQALETNKALAMMDLGDNRLGRRSASSLAKALTVNRALNALFLGGNVFGDEGAIEIAMRIKDFGSLHSLDLGLNAIGAKGAMAIAEGLRSSSTLGDVHLGSKDELGKEADAALNEVLRVPPEERAQVFDLEHQVRASLFGAPDADGGGKEEL